MATKSNADSTQTREETGATRHTPKEGTAAWAATRAVEQLAGLVSLPVEHVTAIEKQDDGWKINIEVVEAGRIPDSTDILATYEVQLTGEGDLDGFHRSRRYLRGRADD